MGKEKTEGNCEESGEKGRGRKKEGRGGKGKGTGWGERGKEVLREEIGNEKEETEGRERKRKKTVEREKKWRR